MNDNVAVVREGGEKTHTINCLLRRGEDNYVSFTNEVIHPR